MKGFPILIEVFRVAEADYCPNKDCCMSMSDELREEGTYIVKSFEDFPSSDYVFKVVEYNYNSEKYGVFQG